MQKYMANKAAAPVPMAAPMSAPHEMYMGQMDHMQYDPNAYAHHAPQQDYYQHYQYHG
jgi:hypothetical protein